MDSEQYLEEVLEGKDLVVTAVCVGKVETLKGASLGGTDLVTAFRKKLVEGAQQVHKLGIDGDEVGNKEVHGGVDKAVYVFGGDDYKWWEKELSQTFDPGSFAENLIINDLDTKEIILGDKLYFPDMLLEVSGPRRPCGKLAAIMGDKYFSKRFKESRQCGFYCRMLEEGTVMQGQKVTIKREPGSDTYISDLLQIKHRD